MRASQWMLTTLRETPNEAEIVSHQLMLRAGLIKKLGAGLYSWLPLGLKVLKKVERIVREEMDKIGALELLMPAVHPAELWQETGRWETFGGQLLTMQDHQGRQYCFGPTHEEIITDLVRSTLHSLKSYPINLYQIQTKFRDEIRPRFGVMRAREFLMKDAYSFHLSQECLQTTYDLMFQAYSNILNRLGLRFRAVEADTGAIGGSYSHEFQVLAQAGEDIIFYSSESPYAANIEKATSLTPMPAKPSTHLPPMEKIATPHLKTIEEVAKALNQEPKNILKTLLVRGVNSPVVALVLRGNDTLNLIKAAKHPLVADPLEFIAENSKEAEQTQLPVGYIGPLALNIPVIADHHAAALTSFTCGANEVDHHVVQAIWHRDAHYDECYDLRNVMDGDASPDGHGTLSSCHGIEVGHVFQLGDKYTQAMNVNIINAEGKNQHPIMGTYGFGVSRVIAAAIEQHHDDRGICWPTAMAPFEWVIIPIDAERHPEVKALSELLYQQALQAGLDPLLDDRQERPGVKFADADLIGIPHRVVVSQKLLAQGNMVEYKARTEAQARIISAQELENIWGPE
jgi:prolyl-tRNA synthetase